MGEERQVKLTVIVIPAKGVTAEDSVVCVAEALRGWEEFDVVDVALDDA